MKEKPRHCEIPYFMDIWFLIQLLVLCSFLSTTKTLPLPCSVIAQWPQPVKEKARISDSEAELTFEWDASVLLVKGQNMIMCGWRLWRLVALAKRRWPRCSLRGLSQPTKDNPSSASSAQKNSAQTTYYALKDFFRRCLDNFEGTGSISSMTAVQLSGDVWFQWKRSLFCALIGWRYYCILTTPYSEAKKPSQTAIRV